jgi:beta-1,4-mannooligosaccharide/beta-1,4-mannosyl-N-acetylglucosamine phosphorylase
MPQNDPSPVSVLRRAAANPILSPRDVPYPATLTFNAGVAKYGGRYVMLFRNDYGAFINGRFEGTGLGLAVSDDGVQWHVQPQPCTALFEAVSAHAREPFRVYDPRLTVIEERCVVAFAVDTAHGIQGGLAETDDFERFKVLSLSVPDNRNMILFPERIAGRYMRLERPFPVYGRPGAIERFDIWLSASPDLSYWGDAALLLGVEDVSFANRKIGPGAPPARTPAGWLVTFHAVDYDEARGKNGWEDTWKKRYTVGLMLLDRDNPRRIVGLSRKPLLAPEAPYETAAGFRNDVVFPCGLIVEDDGEVKLYYGAADAVMCLASAHVDDLLALVMPSR